jgi:hypothetical protein
MQIRFMEQRVETCLRELQKERAHIIVRWNEPKERMDNLKGLLKPIE